MNSSFSKRIMSKLIQKAIEENDIEKMKKILKDSEYYLDGWYDIESDEKDKTNTTNIMKTYLFLAVELKHLEIANLLLKSDKLPYISNGCSVKNKQCNKNKNIVRIITDEYKSPVYFMYENGFKYYSDIYKTKQELLDTIKFIYKKFSYPDAILRRNMFNWYEEWYETFVHNYTFLGHLKKANIKFRGEDPFYFNIFDIDHIYRLIQKNKDITDEINLICSIQNENNISLITRANYPKYDNDILLDICMELMEKFGRPIYSIVGNINYKYIKEHEHVKREHVIQLFLMCENMFLETSGFTKSERLMKGKSDSVVCCALRNGHPNLLQLLNMFVPKRDETAAQQIIRHVCEIGDAKAMEKLMDIYHNDAQNNINNRGMFRIEIKQRKNLIIWSSSNGYTPLTYAIKTLNFEMVKFFIRLQGFDINNSWKNERHIEEASEIYKENQYNIVGEEYLKIIEMLVKSDNFDYNNAIFSNADIHPEIMKIIFKEKDSLIDWNNEEVFKGILNKFNHPNKNASSIFDIVFNKLSVKKEEFKKNVIKNVIKSSWRKHSSKIKQQMLIIFCITQGGSWINGDIFVNNDPYLLDYIRNKYKKIETWLNTQTDALFATPLEVKQEWGDVWANIRTKKDITNQLWKQYCEYFANRYFFGITQHVVLSKKIKVKGLGYINKGRKIRLLEKMPLEKIKEKIEIKGLMYAWSIMYNFRLHKNKYKDVFYWFDYENTFHNYLSSNPLIVKNFNDSKNFNYDDVALKDSLSNLKLKF